MGDRLNRLGARLLVGSRVFDRGYRLFDQLRSELALALASDDVLDKFNDLAYGGDSSYQSSSTEFRSYLYPWEERVIDEFFPGPPARILVGGAGGGREVFPLLERGYEVVAFEPSQSLAEGMLDRAPKGASLTVYRASYEDLPRLSSADPNTASTVLQEVEPFDAAIIGWGSFSHLRTAQHRVDTLRAFREITFGPIVVSFLQFRGDPNDVSSKRARLRKLLPGRFNQDPGNAFSAFIGFYHEMNASEMTDLAQKAGLRIAMLNSETRDTNWPHAVLVPILPEGEPEAAASVER